MDIVFKSLFRRGKKYAWEWNENCPNNQLQVWGKIDTMIRKDGASEHSLYKTIIAKRISWHGRLVHPLG